MKLNVLIFTLILGLTAQPSLAAEKTVTLQVDNMYCPSCAPTVKKSLSRLDGVRKVDVSTRNHTATVTFDDAKTNARTLIEATTNAGYPSCPAK
jgi:periplasmic mercuric ion binding protein